METTRHFTATMYIVCDDKTALHHHPKLSMWLPPGGHIGRDELPHEAAIREASEETGLEVNLFHTPNGPSSATARALPHPETILLEDITVVDQHPSHQHIDFIYFGSVATQSIDPKGTDEVDSSAWNWVDKSELATDTRYATDVADLGIRAIDAVRPK